ncbi:ferrous iron uptake protein feoa, putative [Heliomicrobium modesticaldum Ice1]|uniref:Ferrous iron uptake protein feoa, putative n=1 Tax=Heliobacterium modesticaldum (strain ATCC 51547 / Ice1) TaxID=498761 RepID=B0TCG0_HELMI|nr:ferrous iron transport protein A [Heliomicrobium modesticaldum]ABZ85348.1 ferrous iron uptake protein feoa, putative [Heliomicrobium modesticaldum Ice1]
MTLDRSLKGQRVYITAIRHPLVRAQAIRFGISEGETVTVQEVIPAGPVIVRKRHQELAIGRRMAADIGIRVMA